MLRNLRVKVAASVTPINHPDDLVWKRWLKTPVNTPEEFSFSETMLEPALYFTWPGAGESVELDFRMMKPVLPHRNAYDRFLRVQTTRPKLFHLNPAKSHRLFFSLRQPAVKPPSEFIYNPQVLVFTVFNSKTGVILPQIFKIETRQRHADTQHVSFMFNFAAFEDLHFVPLSSSSVISEISLFEEAASSAFIVDESSRLLFFDGGPQISKELTDMSAEIREISLLETASLHPLSATPKYFLSARETTTEGYPLRKVTLKDYIKVIKPFTHGLRLTEKGFRVFNVNTFEKCSISRNLVNTEFENYTYYPAEFPGLNEIKTDYEMPFLSRETIQRFPKVKIEHQDPSRIPSLFPLPQYSIADEESDGEELYDYQNKGVKLLVKNPFAILSDEDGMGKTLQAVNALRYLIKRKQIRTALVICSETEIGRKRKSVAGGRPEGWIGNLETFAPGLSAVVLSSDKNKRKSEWNSPAQIYIISYENLLADEADEVIGSSRLNQFDCIIMDSYLSNRFTAYQRDRIFNKLKLRYLWIMDNSPIENYESDIVAYFINTVASAPFHQFSASEGIGEFSRRGLLKDMGAELPMRIFRNKWFELTDDQRNDYTVILEQGLAKLRNSVENGNLLVIRPQIFTILHEILQALNFPASGEMSKKAAMLVNEAKRITEHGQKGVILSQYEKYGLKKIEEILTKFDIKFVTYRSGMNSTAMERACQEFRDRPDIHIFLGDVKAINKRLNLGSFNQIIHFDQWWNPVSQWTAEDRISSYNQEHVMVQYYRTANTIEEKIYEKLSAKGLLNKLIIENLTQTVVADMISTEEWFELLDLETEGLLNTQSTISYYESALNSVRGNSFDTIKKLIINFLVKSGFYKISGTGPIADDESSLIMASKMINDKEENVLIKILDIPAAGEEEVKTFLAQMSEQKNISLGIIINRGEFSPVCGKYSAVKINLLSLIDISLLTQYLMHFKLI